MIAKPDEQNVENTHDEGNGLDNHIIRYSEAAWLMKAQRDRSEMIDQLKPVESTLKFLI
jgi:hypothetical protein